MCWHAGTDQWSQHFLFIYWYRFQLKRSGTGSYHLQPRLMKNMLHYCTFLFQVIIIIIVTLYEICYLSISIRFIRRGSSPKSSLLALYTFWRKRHPFRIPSKFYKLTNGTAIAYLVYNVYCCKCNVFSGAPNENIVQNHLNIALLNVF